MADILWENVVGLKTVSDGGHFGDLLTIARAHVDDAVRTNRLTSAQAGEIYTAMIPAAMQQAMQFELSEKLTEAQIDDVTAATELKNANIAVAYTNQVKLDKEAALAGLDDVVKTTKSETREAVYTPKYIKE